MLPVFVDCTFIAIIIICAITDWKKRIISNYAIIVLCIITVIKFIYCINNGIPDIWYSFLILVPLIPIFFGWKNQKVGSGDLKLLICAGIYLGLLNAIISILFTFTVMTIKFRKYKLPLPFATYFAPGAISLIAINQIILFLN